MFKLLAMMVAFLVVGLVLLGLRQRRLELTSETSSVYAQIRERNEQLLDIKVAIAQRTNPKQLALNLEGHGIDPGAALQNRANSPRRGANPPAIERDLVAPVR